MRSRAQTSIELLMVIAFVLVVSLAIVIPYVGSQNITNASYNAKLALLPYLEKNALRVKLLSITPSVVSDSITLYIHTSGVWDADTLDEITLIAQNPLSPSGCERVCVSVRALGGYSTIDINWTNVYQGDVSAFCEDGANDPFTC